MHKCHLDHEIIMQTYLRFMVRNMGKKIWWNINENLTPRKSILLEITTTSRTISSRYPNVKHEYASNLYSVRREVICVLEKALCFDLRGAFRTQLKIYDRAFFAKIVNSFQLLTILEKTPSSIFCYAPNTPLDSPASSKLFSEHTLGKANVFNSEK